MQLVSGLDIMNLGRAMAGVDAIIEDLEKATKAELRLKRIAAIRTATDGLHGVKVTAGTLAALRRRILECIEAIDGASENAAKGPE
jgi:hypothetical protein